MKSGKIKLKHYTIEVRKDGDKNWYVIGGTWGQSGKRAIRAQEISDSMKLHKRAKRCKGCPACA